MRAALLCLALAACGADRPPPQDVVSTESWDVDGGQDVPQQFDAGRDAPQPGDAQPFDVGPRDTGGTSSCPGVGGARCNGVCVDTLTDVEHCGACGRRCESLHLLDFGCSNGVCGGRCEGGWRDCDREVRNGCETSALDDPMNCGRCGTVCDGGSCAGGFCM